MATELSKDEIAAWVEYAKRLIALHDHWNSPLADEGMTDSQIAGLCHAFVQTHETARVLGMMKACRDEDPEEFRSLTIDGIRNQAARDIADWMEKGSDTGDIRFRETVKYFASTLRIACPRKDWP